MCINTNGSFECRCNQYYTGNGTYCEECGDLYVRLSVSSISTSSATITWDQVQNILDGNTTMLYAVYYQEPYNVTQVLIQSVPATASNVSLKGLVSGSTYRFCLRTKISTKICPESIAGTLRTALDLHRIMMNMTLKMTDSGIALTWNPQQTLGVNILWYRLEGQCLQNMFNITVPGNATTLLLTGLKSSSMCTAVITVNTTLYGLVTSSVYTFYADVSSLCPVKLLKQYVSSTIAVIAWDVASSSYTSVQYYDILFPEKVFSVPIAGGATEAALTGLQPSHTYGVYVYCNSLLNLTSEVLLLTTEVNSRSPSNVGALVNSSSSVVVSWVAPVENTGEIKEYRIFYGPANSSEPVSVKIVAASVLATSLMNLKASTTYFVILSAYTFQGTEGPSPILYFSTEAASSRSPSNVAVLATPLASVVVSWVAPVENTGQIKEYRISYGPVNSSEPVSVKTVSASVLATSLTGLQSSTTYFVFVTAFTTEGKEESSPVIYFSINRVPLAVNTIWKSSISVLVNWTSPASLSVSSYDVQFSRVGDNSTSTVNTKDQSVLLQGLLPNSTYSITVTPIINGTTGQPVYITVKTPAALSPGYVSVSNKTTTSALVTWQPPVGDAGLVTGYRVSYSLVTSTEPSTNLTLPATALWVNLTGLKEGTMYSVSVSALTSLGTEDRSQQVYFTTVSSPIVVSSTAKSPTSALVSWTSPASLSVSSYDVQFSRVGDNSSSTVNTKEQTVLLRGLLPNSTYSITVTPITNGTRGRPGYTTVTTAKDLSPSNVAVLSVTGTSAVVTWQPPIGDAGLVTGYRVSYTPENSTEPSANLTLPATALQANLTDLKGDMKYSVSVSALTSLGTEESSPKVNFTTEPLPLAVNATAQSPTSALVNWTSPASLSVSSYDVQFSRVGDNSS
uniref:Uncharacterized protein n=1 Tax=Lepisosteus oculatus TaxID=7918 RepID=W5NJJ1_LEPOC